MNIYRKMSFRKSKAKPKSDFLPTFSSWSAWESSHTDETDITLFTLQFAQGPEADITSFTFLSTQANSA
jgi:hypothetical protein